MDVDELERIQGLIKKSELEIAKAEGQSQSIKNEWKKKYGTDDEEQIKQIVKDLKADKKKNQNKLDTLYQELEQCCDWDALEEELS